MELLYLSPVWTRPLRRIQKEILVSHDRRLPVCDCSSSVLGTVQRGMPGHNPIEVACLQRRSMSSTYSGTRPRCWSSSRRARSLCSRR